MNDVTKVCIGNCKLLSSEDLMAQLLLRIGGNKCLSCTS